MMKRWWIIALVCVLALSLTSCSSSKKGLENGYGFGYCDGSLGSFDVYVFPSDKAGIFELTVIPAEVAQERELTITVTNGNLDYKTMAESVGAAANQEIFAGYLTENELLTYDVLAITPYQPGVSFLNGGTDADVVCTLPLPGEGGLEDQPQTAR